MYIESGIVNLEGLVIENGDSANSASTRGGGVLILGGRTTIRDCDIRSNSADEGGGIAIEAGQANITSSVIQQNSARRRAVASTRLQEYIRSPRHSLKVIWQGAALTTYLSEEG